MDKLLVAKYILQVLTKLALKREDIDMTTLVNLVSTQGKDAGITKEEIATVLQMSLSEMLAR